MTRLKSLKGFTLIELIVVVIIIGVLAAIAAVAYNQFVANARVTAAKADAKQVVTAVSAYGQQNDLVAEDVLDGTTEVAPGVTARSEALKSITGDVTIGAVTGTAPDQLVRVYAGKTDQAKHYCDLNVSGELPVLLMETCK